MIDEIRKHKSDYNPYLSRNGFGKFRKSGTCSEKKKVLKRVVYELTEKGKIVVTIRSEVCKM